MFSGPVPSGTATGGEGVVWVDAGTTGGADTTRLAAGCVRTHFSI